MNHFDLLVIVLCQSCNRFLRIDCAHNFSPVTMNLIFLQLMLNSINQQICRKTKIQVSHSGLIFFVYGAQIKVWFEYHLLHQSDNKISLYVLKLKKLGFRAFFLLFHEKSCKLG